MIYTYLYLKNHSYEVVPESKILTGITRHESYRSSIRAETISDFFLKVKTTSGSYNKCRRFCGPGNVDYFVNNLGLFRITTQTSRGKYVSEQYDILILYEYKTYYMPLNTSVLSIRERNILKKVYKGLGDSDIRFVSFRNLNSKYLYNIDHVEDVEYMFEEFIELVKEYRIDINE